MSQRDRTAAREAIFGAGTPGPTPYKPRPGTHTHFMQLSQPTALAEEFGQACAALDDHFGFRVPMALMIRALERYLLLVVEQVREEFEGERFAHFAQAPKSTDPEYRDQLEVYLAMRMRQAAERIARERPPERPPARAREDEPAAQRRAIGVTQRR